MKAADRLLQRWRIRKVEPYLRQGMRVLDVGTLDGALLKSTAHLSPDSIGIDPLLPEKVRTDRYTLIPGAFPRNVPPNETFDAITMLAVLEHFRESELPLVAEGCARLLKSQGLLLITVPSPPVDGILTVLTALGIMDGMSPREHHGFRTERTPQIFGEPDFRLVRHSRFQLGLNHLFVFRRQ